jgi:xylulokinase
MKHFILAHDLGTTGNKATLYDAEGKLTASVFVGYETYYPRPGWTEQNPEAWWRAVCDSSRELLRRAALNPSDLACISFSGQMMGCVPLGRDRKPLRNAIIWADQRATEEQCSLSERIAPERVYRLTGHRLSASYSLCKILWLKRYEPEVYQKTAVFVQAKDMIAARLTGELVTDHSDASGTNLFDLEARSWSDEIMAAAELEPGKLPALHLSTDVIGEVHKVVADELGVAAGTPVVIGGGDGACAATGAGVIGKGTGYNYIGSSSWIALASDAPVYDPEARTFTWAHLVPGLYSPCGTMQAAGASYQWARDQLGMVERQAAETLGVNPYELMNLSAEKSPPGARGLLFLPYLLGERSPRWNPQARGAFIGLDVRHTREDMLRAVLEGITMNLRIILDALTGQGITLERVRLIGGGARGRFWNQLIADIYGLPVERLRVLEEATSMGAALAGGVGIGLYPGFEMIAQMNPVQEVIEPRDEAAKVYERLYSVFEASYQALAPIYQQLSDR